MLLRPQEETVLILEGTSPLQQHRYRTVILFERNIKETREVTVYTYLRHYK